MSSVCVHGFKHMCCFFSVNVSVCRRWPDLLTCCWRWRPTTQSTQSTRSGSQELEVKFLIVPLKRALIMTWQGQFACSIPQNLNEAPINYTHYPGNWLVCGQTRTPPRYRLGYRAGSRHAHTHNRRRRKRRNITSAAGLSFVFSFFFACVQTCPPRQHTHQTKKQCWCDARQCRCTELISCLKNFKWGFFVLLFLIHQHVPVCASDDPPGARVHTETNPDDCAPCIQTSAPY